MNEHFNELLQSKCTSEEYEQKIKDIDAQLDSLKIDINRLKQENNLLRSKKDIETHVSCCSRVEFYKDQNDKLNRDLVDLRENHYYLVKLAEEKGIIEKSVLFPMPWKDKKGNHEERKANDRQFS